MNRPSIRVFAIASALALTAGFARALAHGAVYRPPPTPSGPGNSAPLGPGTPSGPGTAAPPASPTGPSTAGTPSGGGNGSGGQSGPSTGGFDSREAADWRLWWTFHRDEFIQLKSRLAANSSAVIDDGFGTTRGARGSELPDPRIVAEKVVPALLEALAGERNADVLTAALLALAKIGRTATPELAPKIDAAIRPFLADPVQEVAETAALALGVLAAPSSAQLMADIALDTPAGRTLVHQAETPYRTRAFACYGLGALGQHTKNPDVRRFAVHHLVRVFESDTSATRDVKTAALVGLSLVPLELATPANASVTTPMSSREAGLDWLLAVWNDKQESEHVRAFAATSAAKLGASAPAAAQAAWKLALCEVLRANSGRTAVLEQSAALALGMLGDNDDDELDVRVRQTLQRAARDADGLARRFALISLARIGARNGAGAHTSENQLALRKFLLEELEGASTPMRPWAALAVGVSEALRLEGGGEPAKDVQVLLEKGVVQRRGPLEAGAWCLAAALSRDASARDPILEFVLTDRDSESRPHAALALGLLGWDGAVISLRRVVQDSRFRPLVLRDASIALGLLGSSEAVTSLLAMLDDSPSLAVQSAVSSALGYVGDARAVTPLLAAVTKGGRPDSVRAFAISALGGMCDRDPLPWNASIASSVNYWVPTATLYDPATGTGILDLL